MTQLDILTLAYLEAYRNFKAAYEEYQTNPGELTRSLYTAHNKRINELQDLIVKEIEKEKAAEPPAKMLRLVKPVRVRPRRVKTRAAV